VDRKHGDFFLAPPLPRHQPLSLSQHGSCPTCRHPFLDVTPPSDTDEESSDGEYFPESSEVDEDEDEDDDEDGDEDGDEDEEEEEDDGFSDQDPDAYGGEILDDLDISTYGGGLFDNLDISSATDGEEERLDFWEEEVLREEDPSEEEFLREEDTSEEEDPSDAGVSSDSDASESSVDNQGGSRNIALEQIYGRGLWIVSCFLLILLITVVPQIRLQMS
jgi:hypothetical protein